MSRKTRAANVPVPTIVRAEALLHQSHALHTSGKIMEALEGYDRIIAMLPNPTEPKDRAVRADALHLKGLVETFRNRHGTAMDLIAEAINWAPHNDIFYTHLGTCFYRLGLNERAKELCTRACAMNPMQGFSHYNLGTVLAKMGDPVAARDAYTKALSVNPNDTETMVSIGSTYHAQGDFDSAVHWYKRGAEANPANEKAHYNIGVALHDQARYEEALPHYARALALRPDYILPKWNRGLTRLTLGNLAEGWDDFEARWKFEEQMREVSIPAKRFNRPFWTGQNDAPLRIHLHAEQGVGDTLQFCRYAPLIRDMGHDVRLEVPPPVLDLMRRSLTGERLSVMPMAPDYPGGMGVLDFDMHCPLMSLPRAFKTTLDTVPWPGPYLKTDPAKVGKWAARLAGLPGRKIGLCWAGGKRTHDPLLAAVDGRRSVSVETMAPLLTVPGVSFVSLQLGPTALNGSHPEIADWTGEIQSYDDTAALIEALDLVISVDTSVIHVAAGLGKPVWMMNRYDTCWRWTNIGSETPWYPSMKIIRQTKQGQWGDVVMRIRDMLGEGW